MDSRVERAILFISKNFRSKIHLSALAKESCLSQFHFHRLFKDATKQPPAEYINRIRLEYAAHYLFVYPHAKSQEVAFECGFSSPASFSRSFKKYYNQSPAQYRKRKSLIVEKEIVRPALTVANIKRPSYPSQYFPQRKVAVQRVRLIEDELDVFFKELIVENKNASTAIGFYLDMPFHVPAEECRYYVGIENQSHDNTKDNYLEIPCGYYLQVEVVGNFDEMKKILSHFKEDYIDRAGYYIKSLLGIEKITLPKTPKEFSYHLASRIFYIQVGRK